LAPQPRWTIPVNIRQKDKPVLDAALAIAKADGTDLTSVFRIALAEYVSARHGKPGDSGSEKVDEYFDSSSRITSKLLTPAELRQWTDSDVLTLAKRIRSRKQELEFELRRRGYYFRW